MISQTLEKYPELRGCFNTFTVHAALKDGVTGLEEFALFIREDLTNYRMNFVNKRFNELQESVIEKKKVMCVNGKFTLHEGFGNDCGLKGGKLSGGQK